MNFVIRRWRRRWSHVKKEKLKSFFGKIPDDSLGTIVMTTENQNRFTRIIRVKKRGVAPSPKVGIDRFDEYIEKSGLEPKSYQREGVEFCLRRESSRRLPGGCGDSQIAAEAGAGTVTVAGVGVVGGIIADEMGLGKTIVMMGLILANLAMYRRTLIVVPVALIAQWVAQIKQTIIDTGVKPDLTVVVYHGSAGKRRVVLSEGGVDTVWCLRPPKRSGGGSGSSGKPIDIVITTYGCIAMEEPPAKPKISKKSGSVLSLLNFRADRVIFDEAHHLRNKNSRMFKGAMRVVSVVEKDMCPSPSPSPSVWIVTGTPIQNKISDLKSLCYMLGFKVSDLMTEEQRRAIRDEYVLRRTKVSVGMVADVSGVEEADVTCAPRLQSLKHYKMNVPWGSENELELSREIHQKARSTSDRAERLKLYTRMRQMCVWPALLTKPDEIKKKGESSMDRIEDTHGFALNDFKIAISKQSKMDRVVATMVAEAADRSGKKSIVFCHYRREMTRLRDMLLQSDCFGGGRSDDIAIIDGTVGSRERARIFVDEPKVLILQIRTCSEGLNLQSYSDVYFVSPHWNPCVEDQAIARCYRMGQTSQVRVFRFYMTDFAVEQEDAENPNVEEETGRYISTLDHKCEEIQERKRMLCNEFLSGGVR
jgi:SNF2 family DNA or RNA helicase